MLILALFKNQFYTLSLPLSLPLSLTPSLCFSLSLTLSLSLSLESLSLSLCKPGPNLSD